MNKQEIGSMTAKGGFDNENDICKKFKNYKNDKDAQFWLLKMGYNYKKIQGLSVHRIPPKISEEGMKALGVTENKYKETIKFKKADVQVKIEIIIYDLLYTENISLKKANAPRGYNQVDKRSVSDYQGIWGFDDDIAITLKLFTGDLPPADGSRKENRMFLDEMPNEKVQNLIKFVENNLLAISSDVLRGRGGLSADWFIVTKKNKNGHLDWVIEHITNVCNFYSQGGVTMSKQGSLKIGHITMQRKGGTPDPKKLQFKIDPLDLFKR